MQTKTIFFIGILLMSFNALALIQEINIPLSNNSLPSVKLVIENGIITWSAYKSSGKGSVGLRGLTRVDAEKLLNIARKAKDSSAQIAALGGCTNSVVQSGELGRLTDRRDYQPDDNDKMLFQVICKNNNIVLEIFMSDEDVINHVYTQTSWQDLEQLANDILNKYKQGINPERDDKPR